MSKAEEIEMPKPIGDFVINNAKGIQGNDGVYYHYSEVCKLLKEYRQSEIDELKAELNRLRDYLDEKLKEDIKDLNEIDQISKNIIKERDELKAEVERLKGENSNKISEKLYNSSK